MNRSLRLAALALIVGGCSEAGAPDPATNTPESQVVYEGETTDEALDRFLDTPATNTASKRLEVLSPVAGAVLSDSTAVAFEVAASAKGEVGQFRSRVPRPARVLLGSASEPHKVQHWVARVGAWLSPISVAYAHGDPFSGTGYLFTVSDAEGATVLQVFADTETYLPSGLIWSSLAQAPQPLTLDVSYAFFENNGIPEGGGPFVGGQVSFQIKK